MHEKNYTGLVPAHEQGKEITAEHSVNLETTKQAKAMYHEAKQRLLCVNEWADLVGKLGASFYLTDEKGNDVNREAAKGDYFRIDIIGPGNQAGEGFDWVQVEAIKEVQQEEVASIAMTVRPASNPNTPDQDTAHFYSPESTSTFVVTREAMKLSVSIYDKNIEANKDTNRPIDKIRNVLVGFSAKEGFSKFQWQALAEALLQPAGN